MNDLNLASDKFHDIMFADDTTLQSDLSTFGSESKPMELSTKNINAELTKIAIWLKANKLSLNITKTKFMTQCPSSRPVELNLFIEQSPLDRVEQLNFLGLST
jgi:hypothetical protein